MTRRARIIFAAATLYISWMAMMAVHESGHVLAAIIGGGHVQRVVLPFAGFSRTDVDPNPSPRLEVWGGPLWGSALPVILWLILRRKLSKLFTTLLGFFAGLCLVANGSYLGMGLTMTAGDAAELIKLGTPIWLLVLFGLATILPGLYLWHSLGRLADVFASHSVNSHRLTPNPPLR